jgi:putative oxidoreductase
MEAIMTPALALFDRLRVLANRAGEWVGMLGIRLLLGYEFAYLSGMSKLQGENWFSEIKGDFPFPFDLVSVEFSWFLATWSEILGGIALAIGLATRFFSITLLIFTAVAWVAVHAGNGYNVCSNGYTLPLMFMIMLVPLILSGPGKLSLDHLLLKRSGKNV